MSGTETALPRARSIACPAFSARDHCKHEIFLVHDTGDRHPEDVRGDERHGDVGEEVMQFADRGFGFLPSLPRKRPVPGFVAVCIGSVTMTAASGPLPSSPYAMRPVATVAARQTKRAMTIAPPAGLCPTYRRARPYTKSKKYASAAIGPHTKSLKRT